MAKKGPATTGLTGLPGDSVTFVAWMWVIYTRSPGVGVLAAKVVVTSDSVADEMTLITPRELTMPLRGLAVRFNFTDSESRPSGVIAHEQHCVNSSLSSNT